VIGGMTKFDYSTIVPSGMVGFVSTYTYGVGSERSDLENKVVEMREGFRNDPRAAGYLSELSDISSEVVLGLHDTIVSVDFGTAIEALKSGKMVTRGIWKSESIGLTLQFGTLGKPYIYIVKLSDGVESNVGNRVPWIPSQSDMLSEDWVVLD
jgi:hypothetical protein